MFASFHDQVEDDNRQQIAAYHHHKNPYPIIINQPPIRSSTLIPSSTFPYMSMKPPTLQSTTSTDHHTNDTYPQDSLQDARLSGLVDDIPFPSTLVSSQQSSLSDGLSSYFGNTSAVQHPPSSSLNYIHDHMSIPKQQTSPLLHDSNNQGCRTPTHQRILNRLNSGIHFMRQNEKAIPDSSSPVRNLFVDHDSVPLDPVNPSDPYPPLRQVLELIENALELTLVSDDKSVNLSDLELRLKSWKQKHTSPTRRLSLADRAGSPTATSSSLTTDLMNARKALTDQRAQTDQLKHELTGVKKELTRRTVDWRDRDAKHRAEISQLKSSLERTKLLSEKQQKEFWDELSRSEAQVNDRVNECTKLCETVAVQKSDIDRLMAQNQAFESKCIELQDAVEYGRKDALRLQQEKSRVEKELIEVSGQVNNAILEVAHGSEEVRRTTASYSDAQALQAQVRQLSADLNESKTQRNVLDKTVHSVKHELETVRLQLDDANRREDELQTKLRACEKSCRNYVLVNGELESKLQNMKSANQKRDGDYHSANQLLDGRNRELNDISEKYQKLVGDRDQLSSIRRELQTQLDKARSEVQRLTASDRQQTGELGRLRAELHELIDSNTESKRQINLLQAAKNNAERQSKELKTKIAEHESAHIRLNEELVSTRKDLQNEHLLKLHADERLDKLQTKIQHMSAKDADVQRELQAVRTRLEDKTNELATLKLHYKQVLSDHQDLDHRLKSSDARIAHAQTERDTLKHQLMQENKQFQDKLCYAMTQVTELDKQLVEAKTSVAALTSERDRLLSSTRKLNAKMEKYQDRVCQSDTRAEKLVEERNKYERKARELNKYRTLYTNVLEAGILSNDLPRSSSGGATGTGKPSDRALVDWDVLTEHQQLVSRCRRIIQSAARYTTTLNQSDAMSPENLSTTEDILEALEVVFSSLCAHLAHLPDMPTGGTKDSATKSGHQKDSSNTSIEALTESLVLIHRQCVHVVDQVRGPVSDMVHLRLIDDDVLADLDLACSTLNEVVEYHHQHSSKPVTTTSAIRSPKDRRHSGSSIYSSSSGVATLVSGQSNPAAGMDPENRKSVCGKIVGSPILVVQAITSSIKVVSSVCSNTSAQLLAKYKSVVLQVQSKVEHQVRGLEGQVIQLRKDNSVLKDRLARTSYLSDRAMMAKRKAQANATAALGGAS